MKRLGYVVRQLSPYNWSFPPTERWPWVNKGMHLRNSGSLLELREAEHKHR